MAGRLMVPNYTIQVADDAARERLPMTLRVGSTAGVVLVALTPRQSVRLAAEIEAQERAQRLEARAESLMLRLAQVERRAHGHHDAMVRIGWWVVGLLAGVELHWLFARLLAGVL